MSSVSVSLLLDEVRGVYIPRDFTSRFNFGNGENEWQGCDESSLQVLSVGPESEYYWEAWEDILRSAFLIDSNGVKWTLYQDGSLFAIPEHPSFCFSCWIGEPGDECDNTHQPDGTVLDPQVEQTFVTHELGEKHQ